MPSRLLRPALLAAVLVAALPGHAWAADAVLVEPADAVVTGATRMVVRVATSADDRAERIDATLRRLDGELGPDARHLLCEDAQGCSRDRADHAIDFDPRTGAPFLAPADAQILANGDYVLRIVVSRADESAAQAIDLPLVISAPGTAPADVRAVDEDGEVLLSWDVAPEPDVAGYLVERATETGWTLVAEVPAEAASLVDAPGAGIHAYRVVTLRPDGRGATYETVSRETSVEVAAPDDPPVTDDDVDASGDQATTTPPASTTAPVSDPGPGPDTAVAPEGATGEGASGHDPDAGSAPASEPEPGPSFTTRTVTEDGEVVLGASDAATQAASPGRPVAPIVVGLVFAGLAVRVWRRGRPVHRPTA